MAVRPVFVVAENDKGFLEVPVKFEWYGGFALSQKQKCIDAMHEAYYKRFPGEKLLEISSKSKDPKGIELSAFNLLKYVKSIDKWIPVECAFQGGKVFENGGPYKDLYEVAPIDAKRDPRLKESGRLIGFEFEGREFPLNPTTYFYDWLYIQACAQNPDLSEYLLNFDGFTDIVFNPEKSLNCQARSAAKYVSYKKRGLLNG